MIARPERFSSLSMYKSLKPQPCSRSKTAFIPHSSLSTSEDRCLVIFIFLALLSFHPLHLASPSHTCSRSTLLACQNDLQIIHCSLNPRFDVLCQCYCHFSCSSVPLRPRCTRRTLLTSNLVFARQDSIASPPISERAAMPAATCKFFFLGLIVLYED